LNNQAVWFSPVGGRGLLSLNSSVAAGCSGLGFNATDLRSREGFLGITGLSANFTGLVGNVSIGATWRLNYFGSILAVPGGTGHGAFASVNETETTGVVDLTSGASFFSSRSYNVVNRSVTHGPLSYSAVSGGGHSGGRPPFVVTVNLNASHTYVVYVSVSFTTVAICSNGGHSHADANVRAWAVLRSVKFY
jgi:hypothetical protein